MRIFKECEDLLEKAKAEFQKMTLAYEQKDILFFTRYSAEFSSDAADLAIQARKIPSFFHLSEHSKPSHYPVDIRFPVGYTKEGFFKTVLPMFSHKDTSGKNFIHSVLIDSLFSYFEKYDKENGIHRRYEHGVIAFAFSFSSDFPRSMRYDIDNFNDYEYKKVADDLALFFLKDDGPFQASRFISARDDKETFVSAYFVPDALFPQFYQKVSSNY